MVSFVNNLKFYLKEKRNISDLLVIILAIIISFNLYSNFKKQNLTYKARIEQESKKTDVINKLHTIEKELFRYKELLQRKEINQIINKITQLAQESKLNISSLKPLEEVSFDICTKSSLRLSGWIDNYHLLGNFIAKLESYDELYRVELLNIKPTRELASSEVPKKGLWVDLVVVRFNFRE
ncbi:MAG: type 4a pilus biogenesis protein PilO [Candidatus Omnitrophica bacterium]|nr:type 4a pilus biogenesis protein PilO [Candidatus Omnitrophota bacterium]